jgi:hypothetical protein
MVWFRFQRISSQKSINKQKHYFEKKEVGGGG